MLKAECGRMNEKQPGFYSSFRIPHSAFLLILVYPVRPCLIQPPINGTAINGLIALTCHHFGVYIADLPGQSGG
jgi:hypothetical protein